jgi:uncharacterized membrane protein YkvA (DUF1232 family)
LLKPDRRSIKKAIELLADNKQTMQTVSSAAQKAENNRNSLVAIWDDLTSLFRVVKSWKSGSYREIPWNTVVLSTGAIVYFLAPIDVVPDVIPVLGLIDDIAVVRWVIGAIRGDLAKFRAWEQTQPELESTT